MPHQPLFAAGNGRTEALADDYLYDFEEDDDQPMHDCGLLANGQCMLAGSEDCDWDCPNSHGPFYAGSEGWDKRHDAGVPLDGCECSECNAARAAK